MKRLAFYFDFVCPYAYLASTRIEALCRRVGDVELTFEPVLLGGIFRAIGAPDVPMDAMSAAKSLHNERDLERWAARRGVSLVRPADHPRKTVLALRAALASTDVPRATHALFAAYWAQGRDLEDPSVVAAALDDAGLDGPEAVKRAGSDAIKAALREKTDEAVRLGLFGVPSFVTEGPRGRALFWGQDRMSQVVRELSSPPDLDFYFDYSSPYAYLASTEVRRVAARTGARLVYRPLLLGALFKSIGTGNVPLFEMSEAKRSYVTAELSRWAAFRGVPFVFTSRFPVNTVKPLRMTLLADEARRADLVSALFEAVWVRDLDITDEGVLARIAQSVGEDGPALVQRASGEAAKTALREATAEAQARGVFGVPTFCVRNELFWGQDRLELVEGELLPHVGLAPTELAVRDELG